jgi:putative MATE family efflux protein
VTSPSAARAAGAGHFVEGPITPTLARFALPLLVTNFLHSLSGTWAAIWAGQVLGANALTAVATANVIMFMVMGSAMGIGTAAGVAIGQSLGAGDERAVKRVVGGAVVLIVVLSLVLASVGGWFTPAIVDGIGTPAAARDFAITHLRFTCLAMPSIFTYLVMMMMLRGAGDARTPFRFTLLWIGGTVVLTPLLLTGAFGLPGLGIASLGLAGLAANALALGALVAYVYLKRSPIALHRGDLHHFRPDPVLLRLLIKRGVPLALESILVQGSYFVLLSAVNGYGAATAAAYAASAQLWGYVQLPSNALAAAMSAMAAMNIGAGRWDRVEKIAWRGCGLSFVIASVATAGMYALGDAPLRLFIPAGGEVLAIAWRINLIALWGWIALSVTVGLFAIMRANGAMLAPMLIFALTMWAFRVPFALGLQPLLGDAAIWWSFPFGTMGSALAAAAYYRWGGWREQRPMMADLDTQVEEGHVGE